MKYTREQAEMVLRDLRTYHEMGNDLHPSDINFLNAKFPPIEVGNWYKSERKNKFLGLVKKINGVMFYYNGFNVSGIWKIYDWYGIGEPLPITPATEQEVLDRLTEEAKKRYKVGDRVVNCKGVEMMIPNGKKYISQFYNGFYVFQGVYVLNLSTGEWAEVVESNPINDKIEKFERELAELKELINK